MRSRLFIILIEFLIIPAVHAQTIGQIKAFSDEQFNNGNYPVALREYQRVLFFDSEKQYNDIYNKVATIYYNQKDYDKAIQYYNIAWRAEQNDSIKNEIALKKALCNFKTEDYFSALNELFDIDANNSAYFEDKINLYFGICYYGLNDYDNSEEYFSELVNTQGNNEIHHIFNKIEKSSKKYRPEKIELMSMFFPGLGQFYSGDIKNGLNSILLLSAVSTFAIITAINYSFIDGVLIMTSWFYRYYMGGSTHAGNFAREKLLKLKAGYYSEILKTVETYQLN